MRESEPDSETRPRSGKTRLLGFLVIFAAIAVFQILSLKQAIDADEGSYLAAGRLVSEGRQVYQDFFYPQAPLLPYYLAPFLKLFGTNFLVGRAALLAMVGWIPLLLFLIFRELRKGKESGPALAAGLLYIALHRWTYFHLLLIKGDGISLSAWLAAFLFFLWAISATGRKRSLMAFASGFAISVAANIKAPFLLLALPILVGLAWSGSRGPGRRVAVRELFALVLGTLPPAIPSLWALIRDPHIFRFDNFGYYFLLSYPVAFFNEQKNFELVRFCKEPFHLLGILSCALILISAFRRKPGGTGPAALVGLLLSGFILLGVAYASYPVTAQGFILLIPFFALTLFLAFELFPGRWFRLGLAAALVLAAMGQWPEWLSQAQSQNGLVLSSKSWLGHWRDDSAMAWYDSWSYSRVQAAINAVDQWAKPGEPVLSFWPGYIAPSQAALFPGLENHFGLRVASSLIPDEVKDYHLTDAREIMARLRQWKFRIVIYGPGIDNFLSNLNPAQASEFHDFLRDHYRSVFQDRQLSVLAQGSAPFGAPFARPGAGLESLSWLETVSLEEVTIPGLYGDRLTVFGYLIQPRESGQRRPGVILLHGGFSADSSEWLLPSGGPALNLAQAGYAVLALDQRGSMAHGQDFANRKDLGTAEVNDVLSALGFLRNLPGVNPKRIALIGSSRGAALALRAAEETAEIKLVVGYSSVVDYRLFYCSHGCAQSPEGKSWCESLRRQEQILSPLRGSAGEFCPTLESIARCRPWEAGCRIFADGSPLLHLNQLQTPVLLQQSEADTAAPYSDVQVFERGLIRLQIPHQVFVYRTEDFGPVGHSFLYPFSLSYHPAAAELAWSRTMRALDYYLKDEGFRPW